MEVDIWLSLMIYSFVGFWNVERGSSRRLFVKVMVFVLKDYKWLEKKLLKYFITGLFGYLDVRIFLIFK